MIVVDTNLLVHLYVEGERTREAEAVLARDSAWGAPLLWRSEFRNVLVGLVRQRALALEDAVRVVSEAEHGMAGREFAVPSVEVLHLAGRSGCSAYDCEFVALARDLGVPLVTSDRRLRLAFPDTALAPSALAE